MIRLKTESLSYIQLRAHYPALFVAYCQDEGRASKLFAHPVRDEKGLIERARVAAERGIEKTLLETLRRYHLESEAPAESAAALEKLGRGAAVVVTGQQPSVGGGPLYDFYKAQTAVRLAHAVEARGVPCVAVFWNHSDDVRGGDVAAFPDRENRVKEIPLPPSEAGLPLYEAGSPEALRMFASVLAEAMPRTEHSPWVEEFLLGTHRGSVAQTFTRTLLGLLGRSGLVVLEPRHLEGERASRFFDEHQAQPERLSRAVEAGRQAVQAEAFEDHLGRDVGLDLFEIRNGRRLRVERPGGAKGRLSAGVALRPLLQDAVLPTCAYVGGPSEVGYQAALLPAYRAFGIEPPVVFPRVTATLLEPKVARLAEKAGGVAAVFGEEGALARSFEVPGEDVPSRIGSLAGAWEGQISELLGGLAASASIQKAQERTAGKVREALEALSARVKDELSRQETTGKGQLAKLLAHVRPLGKLQERVFTPLYYQALFGPDFASKLAVVLDPFLLSHQIITIL